MNSTITKILICFFLLISLQNGFGQYGAVHEIINFSPKEYGAHNQNSQVVQDRKGVLYFANGDGVLISNGESWNIIKMENKANVLSIGKINDGTIYYSGVGEFGILSHNEKGFPILRSLVPEAQHDELSSEFFWDIHTSANTLIIRSENYLIQIQNSKTQVIPLDGIILKHSFLIDDVFWCQDFESNLYQIPINNLSEIKSIKPVDLGALKGVTVLGILKLTDDKLLFSTHNNGSYIYTQSTKNIDKFETSTSILDKINMSTTYMLSNGDLAFGTTNSGVFILNNLGELKYHYNKESGLKTNAIRSVFEDREGLIWVCTDMGVSLILYNRTFTTVKDIENSFSGIPNALIIYKNDIVIAMNEGVLFVKNNTAKDNPERFKLIEDFSVQSFDLEAFSNDLLCATTSGLFSINDSMHQLIQSGYARAIGKINDNFLLLGGRNSLSMLKKTGTEWITVDSIPLIDEVLHLEKDPKYPNVFWAGLYSSGVARVEYDTLLKTISVKYFSGEIQGKEGYILPYKAQGEMKFAPRSLIIQIFNNETQEFEKESNLNTYFTDSSSIWVLKEDLYKNVFIEKAGPIFIVRKTKDGYSSDSTSLSNLNYGYINDIYCHDDGITWLAAEEGLLRFDPTEIKSQQKLTYTLITKVVLNGDSIIASNIGHAQKKKDTTIKNSKGITYENHNISFNFASPQFANLKEIKYQYQLLGYDDGFSQWKKETKAFYTNLPEGKYTFRVKSLNPYGIESEICEYNFIILPPWYRSWLAYLVYFILSVIAIYLIVYLNSIRLKRANKRLHNLVKVKTKVITQNLNKLAQQKEELEYRNLEIMDSIHYAKRLQEAILPSDYEIQHFLKDNFVFYLPKDIVAGDFYWMETTTNEGIPSLNSEELVLIAVADCTGHGVPGAMVSVVCSDALSRSVNEYKLTNTNEILNQVNELVIKTFNSNIVSEDEQNLIEVKDGMDIALCSINKKTQTIQFSGANNPIWVLSTKEITGGNLLLEEEGNKLYEFKGDRQPIGSYEKNKPFRKVDFNYNEGDILYLFTDGIIDQFGGARGKKFKRNNLQQLILETLEDDMKSQLGSIQKALETWMQDFEQIDDICMMGIRL